uniref:Uncharacterized protein n=1 Tax=Arundo donax TaxID=35708 RepID=A0A0A8ZKS9_ARUDO
MNWNLRYASVSCTFGIKEEPK